MIYLDTSFIVPLAIAEDSSDAVEAIVLKAKPGELATSHWTQIEIASLIARKVRMGELSAAQADAVRSELRKILQESFSIILPTAIDFDTAQDYLETPKTGLRAGDAFHLAIAANHGARKIWSLDQGFLRAGKQLKLPVSAG
jgi:predicted nucleic acid-binding protein